MSMVHKEKKLQVHNLSISFRTNNGKVQAVRDISFDLYKGETLAIVGESGSGKSVTSKAILGIQAANAIYEGGEILYDGQDLLKIDEEDFYKLRGDKIAMIFQDPLSSLNPIMRIGKQLTEAMLLKGKARQRSCKKNFDEKLSLLEKNMIESTPEKEHEIKELCKEFRTIEKHHTALERSYSNAYNVAELATEKAEDLLMRMKQNAAPNAEAELDEIADLCKDVFDEYVVPASQKQRVENCCAAMCAKKAGDTRIGALEELNRILKDAVNSEKPDFFALGYAQMKGYSEKTASGSVEEMNIANRRTLNEEFLNHFAEMAKNGVEIARSKDTDAMRRALDVLRNGRDTFESPSVSENELREAVTKVCDAVNAVIDPLDITKDSASCTFSVSMKDFMKTYSKGVSTNAAKQRKYNRQEKKYNALIARGKNPDWQLAAASVIDLEQVKENMLRQVDNMIAHYEERFPILENRDSERESAEMIDYLTENAAGMVYKVSKHMAKQRAIHLMEEVGIPEPEKRYRAYPFEFSGGMRQRIVIAIALAANPDILICDEPTTALDVTIQAQILELINKLKKQRNLSIIFITHDLGVVANMADRIAVMYAGKIVEYGTSEEVFYSPAHPYTWALLSSMPDLDTKEKLEAIPGTPPNMIYPPKGDAFAARNKYAMKIDFERQPPKFNITDTHWAATWLLHPNAPKIDPPAIVTERIARMKSRSEKSAEMKITEVEEIGGDGNE